MNDLACTLGDKLLGLQDIRVIAKGVFPNVDARRAPAPAITIASEFGADVMCGTDADGCVFIRH